MSDNEPIRLRSDRRKQENKNNKSKWFIRLGIPLTLLLVSFVIGISIKRFFDQQALNTKIDAEKQIIIESSKKTQAQNGFETKEAINEKQNITEIIYVPTENSTIPITDFQSNIKKMMTAVAKEQDTKQPLILIGGVSTSSYTEQLGSYQLKVDAYQWQTDKNDFKKITSTTGEPTYMNQKTGKPVTSKELILDDAGLLGIHHVIQQKILDASKEPQKILDAVLALPPLTWKSKITYSPKELHIKLDPNKTGVEDVTLSYDNIRSFIQQNLVDPSVLETEKPVLDPNKKYIALTFDDGPSPLTTPKILDVLAKKNVHATFFMLGENAAEYPELVKKVQAGGHVLASHSYTHPQLTAISNEQVLKEIHDTDRAIFKASGCLPRAFRPPYGDVNATVAKEIGKPVIQWDIDSLDWQSKNSNSIIQMVNQAAHSGGIILMHDIQQATADALATVIDNLHAQGYEFLTIEEMFQFKEQPLYQYFSIDDYRKI